jgi:hypothetical protein
MKLEKIKDKAPWMKIILDDGETVKGYKAMNKDWTCRSQKYDSGKTYHASGEVIPCQKGGFHFCKNLIDCFSYYVENNCIIVEVEAWGTIIQDGTKLCAEHIKIGKQVLPETIQKLYVDGYGNSGYRNSGGRNSGDRNSGDGNSSDGNSGDRNSGYWNSGNGNSGYGNTTDHSSGVFCTVHEKPILIFDMPSTLTLHDWYRHPARVVCDKIMDRGIPIEDISPEDRAVLETIPNWDEAKFKLCIEALRRDKQ